METVSNKHGYRIIMYLHIIYIYIVICFYIYIYTVHTPRILLRQAAPGRGQQLPQRVQRWALVGEGLAQRGAAGGTDRSGVAQEPPEILGRWKNRGAGYHLSSIGMVHTDHVHSRETYQHLSSIIKQTCC